MVAPSPRRGRFRRWRRSSPAWPAPAVWRKVDVEGGPDGILARRPGTAHPQGYVYDLWLVERLADRLGA
jgi:hypothetical protein